VTDLALADGQPPLDEVVAEGDPLGGAVVAVMHLLHEVAEDPLCISAGGAALVPAVAFLAGGRVGAFVDDGVVALALLGDVASHCPS
jgi:hypothetical protein